MNAFLSNTQSNSASYCSSSSPIFRLYFKYFIIFSLMFLFISTAAKSAAPDVIKRVNALSSDAVEDRPLISADGNIMFFSSSRFGHTNLRKVISELYPEDISITINDSIVVDFGKYNIDSIIANDPYIGMIYDPIDNIYRYDMDIYYSKKINGQWSEPIRLGDEINTSKDDGILSISPDGRTIYFVSFKNDYELDGGPIYKATFGKGICENIQGLGGGITEFYFNNDYVPYDTPEGVTAFKYILGGSISPDGKEFFFAANLECKCGKTDIFVSKFVDGKWSYPKNLGGRINAVNVSNREPYLAYDNKTLYFSSNREGGFGNLDIYYSRREDGKWSEPKNLGSEVNTEYNEYQISIPLVGNNVYITSDRGKSEGNYDIFETALSDIYLPTTVIIKGTVRDKQSGEPVEAKVKISNSPKADYEAKSSPETGEFTIYLPTSAGFDIIAASDWDKVILDYDNPEFNTDFTINLSLYGEDALKTSLTQVSDDASGGTNITYAPNPVNDNLTITIGKPTANENIRLTILNTSGAVVFEATEASFSGGTLTVDFSRYSSGAYFIQVIIGNERRFFRVVKV